MQENGRWVWSLAWRTFSYAFWGALFCGIAGMMFIAMFHSVTTSLMNSQRTVAELGWSSGGLAGGITGALSFGAHGFSDNPQRSFTLSPFTFRKIFFAMMVATVGATISYLLVCYGYAAWKEENLSTVINHSYLLSVFGAPTIMSCGQVAGTIWALRCETREYTTSFRFPVSLGFRCLAYSLTMSLSLLGFSFMLLAWPALIYDHVFPYTPNPNDFFDSATVVFFYGLLHSFYWCFVGAVIGCLTAIAEPHSKAGLYKAVWINIFKWGLVGMPLSCCWGAIADVVNPLLAFCVFILTTLIAPFFGVRRAFRLYRLTDSTKSTF